MPTVLIVDPDPQTRASLESHLTAWDAEILEAEDGVVALDRIRSHEPDLVIADLHCPGTDGMALLEECRQRQIATVMTAAFGSVADAVAAMRAGATDFVSKPFSTDQLQVVVDRALQKGDLERENRDLKAALDDRLRLGNFVSTDPRMQDTLKIVRAVAPTRTTVLITGESGTGKTLLARAIHSASDRAQGPFIEVNCGALPENLLESELFGHVRGAFTGAVKSRAGKFEAADGGTIFLDEIGTASMSLQIKLLRVLQERRLERVGDSNSVSIDVRVILATNLDLEAAVRDGSFREDLYYRINVVPMHVPPLRERRGDISALADHFLARFRDDHGKPVRGIARDAAETLEAAPWPGNVRQLENVIERAVVLSEGEWITRADLPPDLAGGAPPLQGGPQSMVPDDAHLRPLKEALEEPERLLIERALEHHQGNRQRTAETLGINRSTLFNKMRKYGLM